MKPEWDKEEWTELFRLLKKFCPRIKKFFNHPNELSMDSVHELIMNLEPKVKRETINDSEFKGILAQTIKTETGRAIVIPDLGNSHELPFVCKVDRLLERINEGKGKLKKSYFGDDLLIVFETTGKLLLCDHEDGYTLTKEKLKTP